MLTVFGRYVSVLLVLLQISQSQAFTRGYNRKCLIPDGPLYERSIYETSGRSRLAAGSSVLSGGRIIITCKADIIGDIIAKQHFSYCRKGRWLRKFPPCIEYKRCAAPAVIPGTTVSEPLDEYITFPHEYAIFYTCIGDAELIGHDERVCKNGIWSEPEFSCREFIEIACQPPQHGDFLYEPILEGYAENDTVYVTGCEGSRMVLEGSPELTCLPSGRWSGCAVCRIRKRCRPTVISHGVVLDNQTGVKVKCRYRYTYDTATPLTIDCIDGRWVGQRPKCRPALCTLPAPKMASSLFVNRQTNLIVTDVRVPHGDQIRQYCRNGRGLTVDNTCFLGRWKKRFQTCDTIGSRYRSAAPCQLPDSVFALNNIDNETVEVTGAVTNGNSVQVSCREDSLGAGTVDDTDALLEVYCLEGVWVPELPECSPAKEPDTGTKDIATGSTDNAEVTTDHVTDPETDADSSSTNISYCSVMTNTFVPHDNPGRLWRRIATRTQFVYGVRTANDCQKRCLEWTEFTCTDIEVRSVENSAGFINCNLFYIDPKQRQTAVSEDPDSIFIVYQRTYDASCM